ncbi:hypothetical protein Peur_058874 [Populus x canadensis]
MIPGGCMVLTIFGRDENIDSSVKHSPTIREFFGKMLILFYGALAEEVRDVIQAEGSFTIKRLESFHVSWDASIDDRYRDTMDKYTKGKFVAKRMRATMESILARHFGDEIVDCMETVNGAYNNHVVSMAKA